MPGIERPILLDVPAEFVGERVVLRGWRDDDTDALFAAIRESAERVSVWLPWPKEHQTPDDTRAFIRRSAARFLLREGLEMGMFARDDGRVLGGTGFHPLRWDVPAFEIGYWLCTAAEGHGYMSEAARLLTSCCFETLDAQRVMIYCDARNSRSAAVPQRLGFIHEGTLRRDSIGTDGEPRDTMIWAMIPDDYARARGGWGR